MRLFLILFISTFVQMSHASQIDSVPQKSIRLQTGEMFDNYNSMGIRFLVEYQQQFKNKKHIFWGIGFDTKQALYRIATDNYGPPELNTHNFSFNFHYQLKLWKDKILSDFSIGPNFTHAFIKKQHYLLKGAHLGALLNIKLGKHIYFETAPLLFIPIGSDFYLTNSKPYPKLPVYLQYSVLPLGVRFIL